MNKLLRRLLTGELLDLEVDRQIARKRASAIAKGTSRNNYISDLFYMLIVNGTVWAEIFIRTVNGVRSQVGCIAAFPDIGRAGMHGSIDT